MCLALLCVIVVVFVSLVQIGVIPIETYRNRGKSRFIPRDKIGSARPPARTAPSVLLVAVLPEFTAHVHCTKANTSVLSSQCSLSRCYLSSLRTANADAVRSKANASFLSP
jgi:hypothetical protein